MRELEAGTDDAGKGKGDNGMKVKWNGFEVSGRARNCLLRRGIRTIEQLSKMTPKELLKIRNLGETTLEELRALLEKQGLSLKDDN